MKVTVDVDCTPEEARRFLGLPDLTPVHDAYVEQDEEGGERGRHARIGLSEMMKSWGPMSEAGMAMWRRCSSGMARPKA